ncbi:MAG TPA: glycosyltransferase family 1 protein, partial [Jatrophihabitantaceae bacterium]|nr:glycosyltransferase family 1 protein [Jatrophihabitantaceae bacterium]
PALREIAGGCARLVPYADVAALSRALDEVVQDETQRKAMTEAGRKVATAFDWDAAARDTWDVYRAAVRHE